MSSPNYADIEDAMYTKFNRNLSGQESGLSMASMAACLVSNYGERVRSCDRFLDFLTEVENMVGRVRSRHMDMFTSLAKARTGELNDSSH